MSSLVPKFYKKGIVDVIASKTLKIMLLSSLHTPNAALDQFIADISVNEIVDSGGVYPAGGLLLSGKTGNYDGNNAYFDANDIAIGPAASLNYRYAVVYEDTGNPATSPIIGEAEFTEDQIVTNGTSTITWNALGIIYLS